MNTRQTNVGMFTITAGYKSISQCIRRTPRFGASSK